MAYRFRPPIESPFLRVLINAIAPLVLRQRNQVVRVDVSGVETLAALRGQRALLLPNHPSETEPSVMALVARQLDARFYFLATHELFTGFDGWIAQRMGAFSVRRGWPDRRSLAFASGLLAQGKKLVVFPEGETHLRGNELIPLKHGAAQIGFWALECAPGPLPLVPIHVSYHYIQPEQLLTGLPPLERALGIAATGPPSQRLRACGIAVLERVERLHDVPVGQGSVGERIARLYHVIEAQTCTLLACAPPHGDTIPVRLRALFNAAFDQPDSPATRLARKELWRVQNFMAVRDEVPETYERFAELLFRLEKEVYGKPKTLPLRIAHVRIGEPLELSDYTAHYQRSRKAGLATVTDALERRLNGLLAEALATEKRIPPP